MGIRVRAKSNPERKEDEPRKLMGYYGLKRRYEGDEFEIERESEFSTKWMEKLDAVDEEPVRGRGRPRKQELSRA